MTVSVCIPTCNSSRYLRECVDSVLAQTYQDFELIVSDGASIDDTCDIVRSYSDQRIHLHRIEHSRGIAFNLNHAAKLANGKYIKLLCHDDLIEPDCLTKQVRMLEQNPALVMAASGLRHVDAAGRTLRWVSWCPRETVLSAVDVVAGNLIYGNILGSPSATLIRRECLVKAGPFSDQFPQLMDMDMWLRLASMGPVGYTPEPLCRFRLHAGAMTEELRKTGAIRKDLLRFTETMLSSVFAPPLVRWIAWGRVAGSFLRQALAGFRHGYVRWPLSAIGQALRMDPAFAGLAAFQILFRTGLLGLRAGAGRNLSVGFGKTLHNLA